MSPNRNNSSNTTSLAVDIPSPNRGALIRQHLAHFESLAAATAPPSSPSAPSAGFAMPPPRSSSPFSRFNTPRRSTTVLTGDGRPSLKERWARIRSSYRQQQSSSSSPSSPSPSPSPRPPITSPIERPGTPIPSTPVLAPLSLTSLPSPSPLSLSPPSLLSSSPIPVPIPSRNSVMPMTMMIPRTPRTPPMEPIQEVALPAAPRRNPAVRGRASRDATGAPVAVVGTGVDAGRLSSPLPLPLPVLRLRQRRRRDSADAFDADVRVTVDEDEDEDDMSDIVGLLDEATQEWGWSPAPGPSPSPSPSPSSSPPRSSHRTPSRRSHRRGYPSPLAVAPTGIDSVPSLIEMVDRAADEWTPSI